jgi:hypothetical protein
MWLLPLLLELHWALHCAVQDTSHSMYPWTKKAQRPGRDSKAQLAPAAEASPAVLQAVPLQPDVQLHTPGAEQFPFTHPAGQTAKVEERERFVMRVCEARKQVQCGCCCCCYTHLLLFKPCAMGSPLCRLDDNTHHLYP